MMFRQCSEIGWRAIGILAGLAAAALLAWGLWGVFGGAEDGEGRDIRTALVIVLLCGTIAAGARPKDATHPFDLFIFQALVVLAALIAGAVLCAVAGAAIPFDVWILWVAAGIVAIPAAQWGIGRFRVHLARPPRPRNTVIICAGGQGLRLAQWLRRNAPDARVLGFFEDRGADRVDMSALPGPHLGPVAGAVAWCRANGVERVFIALPGAAEGRIADIVTTLSELPVEIYLSPDLSALSAGAPEMAQVSGLPSLRLSGAPVTGWRALVKRVEDIVGALLAIAIFSPVFIVLPILIRLESPGPVLFRQKRYGLGGREFDFLKFRSMYIQHCDQKDDIKLTERVDPRVTRIGNFIRRTSLDELPQLFNVLRGDMSLVGPRPHPKGVKAGERTYEEVIDAFARRYRVKPGITGLAQVSGARGNTFTEEDLKIRFAYDMEYIQNWSLWLDIRILLNTVVKGFTGKNAF